MNDLIAITEVNINNQQVQTVNARELHAFLEVGKDFSNWIKAQIDRARLLENRDYVVFAQKGENQRSALGGRPTKEYHLTFDAGKHIAMMSGTDNGFTVRDYFIECERRAKDNTPALPKTYTEALRHLLAKSEECDAQAKQIEADRPKTLFADSVAASKTSILIRDMAKLLKQNGIDMGQIRLFDWLRSNGFLIRAKGRDYNSPTQRSMELGLFEIKETTINRTDGIHVQKTPLVTGKGQRYFVDKFLGRAGTA